MVRTFRVRRYNIYFMPVCARYMPVRARYNNNYTESLHKNI